MDLKVSSSTSPLGHSCPRRKRKKKDGETFHFMFKNMHRAAGPTFLKPRYNDCSSFLVNLVCACSWSSPSGWWRTVDSSRSLSLLSAGAKHREKGMDPQTGREKRKRRTRKSDERTGQQLSEWKESNNWRRRRRGMCLYIQQVRKICQYRGRKLKKWAGSSFCREIY